MAMSASAVVMRIVAVTVIWGGRAGSAVHAVRH